MAPLVTRFDKIMPRSIADLIDVDDALLCMAEILVDEDLFTLLLVCMVMRTRLVSNDAFWQMRLAGFAALYPALAHLEIGENESGFHWYARWRHGVASAESIARDHYEHRQPFMRLFGSFDGGTFVVHTPLRLPATQGLIAEVMACVTRLGKPHAAKDAALMFVNAPVNADRQFQTIAMKVQRARQAGINRPDMLQKFVAILEQVYVPTLATAPIVSPATVAASSSEVHFLQAALAAEQTHSEARERVLRTVRLRLTRTQQELARAYARIAELELEVLELRVENGELRLKNHALEARVAQLEGRNRCLQRELDDRPPKEKLTKARKQLAEARRNASAAAKKMRPIYLERARLVKQLHAAEERYTEAEEDLASIRADEELVKDLMNLREAELEADKAAQVAAAQHQALVMIQGAIDVELAAREYYTPDQLVDLAIEQAERGVTSLWSEKITAHVMATKAKAGESITLAPTNESGRGRGRTYLSVVKHTKPSDQVSTRELYNRSKEIRESLAQTSVGAEVKQLQHFIQTNKALMKLALDSTWLSPPRSPTLHDLVALRNETTGQMYEVITGFFKDKCGVKFGKGLSKTKVKAACDDLVFDYDLHKWTEEVEKEEEDKATGKKKKVIVKHGADALVVKDAVDAIIQSAKVHVKAGRVSYPANVPPDVWPISVMIDAGAGITKVAVKHVCVDRAAGVRAITLLGVMVGAKDTYSAMKRAFGRLYQQINEINKRVIYVDMPWKQRVPVTAKIEFSDDMVLTMMSCDPEMYLTMDQVAIPKAKKTAKMDAKTDVPI